MPDPTPICGQNVDEGIDHIVPTIYRTCLRTNQNRDGDEERCQSEGFRVDEWFCPVAECLGDILSEGRHLEFECEFMHCSMKGVVVVVAVVAGYDFPHEGKEFELNTSRKLLWDGTRIEKSGDI